MTVHGFHCPECNHAISPTMSDLLDLGQVRCNGCGLTLTVSHGPSTEALQALGDQRETLARLSGQIAASAPHAAISGLVDDLGPRDDLHN